MNDKRNEFALCQILSRLFQMAETVKCRRIYQDLIYWGQLSSLRSCLRRLFKLSIKRAIRQFHIRSRAATAKKYTNSCVAKLLFCLLNQELLTWHIVF